MIVAWLGLVLLSMGSWIDRADASTALAATVSPCFVSRGPTPEAKSGTHLETESSFVLVTVQNTLVFATNPPPAETINVTITVNSGSTPVSVLGNITTPGQRKTAIVQIPVGSSGADLQLTAANITVGGTTTQVLCRFASPDLGLFEQLLAPTATSVMEAAKKKPGTTLVKGQDLGFDKRHIELAYLITSPIVTVAALVAGICLGTRRRKPHSPH